MALSLEGCVLRVAGPGASGRLELGFPPPCRFADDGRGGVQTVRTPAGEVVLVESSRPLPSEGSGVRDCDTRLRAVVVSGTSASVSAAEQRVASCALGSWDALMFEALAAQTVPVPATPAAGR